MVDGGCQTFQFWPNSPEAPGVLSAVYSGIVRYYLISNKRYNAVARIVQRFPAERYVQLMVTMLKMGPAGMCDTASGALTKLELCNFGGVIVTETVEDVMANGTLAQKEWVAEAVIESTEEIPARMREQLIALEDSIGSSMRKALKKAGRLAHRYFKRRSGISRVVTERLRT